jgi:hypothetical protein
MCESSVRRSQSCSSQRRPHNALQSSQDVSHSLGRLRRLLFLKGKLEVAQRRRRYEIRKTKTQN